MLHPLSWPPPTGRTRDLLGSRWLLHIRGGRVTCRTLESEWPLAQRMMLLPSVPSDTAARQTTEGQADHSAGPVGKLRKPRQRVAAQTPLHPRDEIVGSCESTRIAERRACRGGLRLREQENTPVARCPAAGGPFS